MLFPWKNWLFCDVSAPNTELRITPLIGRAKKQVTRSVSKLALKKADSSSASEQNGKKSVANHGEKSKHIESKSLKLWKTTIL